MTGETTKIINPQVAGIEKFPTNVTNHQLLESGVSFTCENHVELQVIVIENDIIRFRYSPSGNFLADHSYAIDPEYNARKQDFHFEEFGNYFSISTKSLVVNIKKKDLKVTILNTEGKVVNEDEKGFHWEENEKYGGEIPQISKKIQSKEHFFGLGDKAGNLNMRGERFQLWGTDAYGYGKNTDPLYKNIPFYTGVHNGLGYGIFYDNSFRTFFDFGKERGNVSSFWSHGGEMNYYFIYGPKLTSVTEKYALLTGRAELPPLWALAYHQCKWSYYPESQVKEITKEFRRLNIPCDAIYLDIDYMDGFKCFTWDETRFPDPKRMIAELEEEGFKTVVMIDPGIKIDKTYWVYNEGVKHDYFCKRQDGPLFKAPVWPGMCHFPDYTNPEVRTWWAGLYKEMIADVGVRGVWNDMNEPAIFMADNFTQSDKQVPADVRHHFEGNQGSHRQGHNVYGMQMARATHEGLKQNAPDRRPFVITRSTYAGGQRFSSGWTGDNLSSWEHLWIANIQCQRLSISGFSFAGSDIGGFIGQPDGELFVRWLQMGVFHVFFRTHSSGDHGEQEPWSFGEPFTSAARKAIELRYKLLPYMYTVFWKHTKYGEPMLKPISYIDQEDPETLYRMEEFGLGDQLLIIPINKPKQDGRWVYLPKGDWYYYWSDQQRMSQEEIWAEAPLDQIPFFVRAGAVIPQYPVQQFVGEYENPQVQLHVYNVDGENRSELYLDSGDGYEYQTGQSRTSTFTTKGNRAQLKVSQIVDGAFEYPNDNYKMYLHGIQKLVESISIDGELTTAFETVVEDEKEMIKFDCSMGFKSILIVYEK